MRKSERREKKCFYNDIDKKEYNENKRNKRKKNNLYKKKRKKIFLKEYTLHKIIIKIQNIIIYNIY